MTILQDNDEPNTIEEALSSFNKEKWINVSKDEMESMKENQVWKLVELSKAHKAIRNRWVLTVKRKTDRTIESYKAHLVAKGYTQKEGIDYDETFSLVVRFALVRLILTIVASLDLELYQMDVKTIFLEWGLEEDIYMQQPNEFVEKGQKHKACKLLKLIYGLKQSSRQWYLRFHEIVMSNHLKWWMKTIAYMSRDQTISLWS